MAFGRWVMAANTGGAGTGGISAGGPAARARTVRAAGFAVVLVLALVPLVTPWRPAAAGTGRAVAAAPAVLPPVAGGPAYRIGYASADVPALAAVDPGTGTALAPPAAAVPADEASARSGALVYVTHRPGR